MDVTGFVLLMNPVDDVIVQQLLFVIVQDGVELLVLQSSIFPDLLQGVVLDQAAVLKHSHQQVLLWFASSSLYCLQESIGVSPQ